MPAGGERSALPYSPAARRCIWSNRLDPGTREVTVEPEGRHLPERFWVCPEHEAAFREFHRRVHREQRFHQAPKPFRGVGVQQVQRPQVQLGNHAARLRRGRAKVHPGRVLHRQAHGNGGRSQG